MWIVNIFRLMGRYFESVSVSVERNITEIEYGDEKLIGIGLNIFSNNINIFKRYRHLEGECDIIEKNSNLRLLKTLPLEIVYKYERKFSLYERRLSDDEMAALACSQLCDKLNDFLSDKEALRLRSYGEFTDTSYVMSCDTVVRANVAKTKEFKLLGE